MFSSSTDSGWDNPFRPGGDLSREADEIVNMIKGKQKFEIHLNEPSPNIMPIYQCSKNGINEKEWNQCHHFNLFVYRIAHQSLIFSSIFTFNRSGQAIDHMNIKLKFRDTYVIFTLSINVSKSHNRSITTLKHFRCTYKR